MTVSFEVIYVALLLEMIPLNNSMHARKQIRLEREKD